MALFGWFSKDTKAAVEKQSKRLMNKYQQTAERQAAIETLTKIGSEDAVIALLKRFQFRIEQSINDEQEKELVYKSVVSLGPAAVPGIKQYIETESGTYWPIKALRALVGDDEAAHAVLHALDGITNTFGQNRERKQQLVDNLRNFAQNDQVFDRLLQLAHDEDEEVVIRAVDGLSAREGRTEHIGKLIDLILAPDTSVRVRMMIFELMVDNAWKCDPEHLAGLAAVLPGQYKMDSTGTVSRKK